MPKQWYAEERRFDGGLYPVIYHGEKPSDRRAGGGKRELVNLHEITSDLLGMTLHQLHLYFNKDKPNENEHRPTEP